MNVSRKDFFRQSLFSLGRAVCSVTGAIDSPGAKEPEDHDGAPVGRKDHVAVARNELCLARNCGCFACVERCEVQAIQVVMGEGIRIDDARCTGCGSCEYVCPVTPKVIELAERSAG